jgi:hypothetical protein
MPLIINTPTTPTEKSKSAPARKAPQDQVRKEIAAPKSTEKFTRSEPRVYEDMGDQYIVVNGKPKKISKHSQYLVDMLTTEE